MITNRRIALELGVHEPRISEWKSGARGVSLSDARLIKDRTGLSLEFILYDKPQVVLKRITKILERQIK